MAEFNPSSARRKLKVLSDDIREIREQGKKAISDPGEVYLFVGMMNSIQGLYESYDMLYQDLSDCTDDNGELIVTADDHLRRSSVKRYWHESNGYLAQINDIKTRQSTSSANISGFPNASIVIPQHKTKLPVLELPKFNGDRTGWPRFSDTFTSLVKDDAQLRDIDKFHYLVRSLQGSALSVIAHLPVTETNFVIAWNTLVEAYDNKRLLATAYLDQILETKKLTSKPNAATLLQLVSTLSDNISAFQLLAIDNHLEFIYFYLANRCLDPYTREQFEMQNTDTFPTFDKFIKYLRSRCTASELASGSSSLTKVKEVHEEKRKFWSNKPSLPSGKTALVANSSNECLQSESPRSSTSSSSHRRNPLSCFVCKGPHLLPNCVKFSNVPVAERHRLLRTWQGCRNCLHYGHTTSNCNSKYFCKFCKHKHHSLLHGYNSSQKTVKTQSSQSFSNASNPVDEPITAASNNSTAALNTIGVNHLEVMLGTAICNVVTPSGEFHKIRLAIDSGSQFSFITRSFAERIGLDIKNHSAGVRGIGEIPLTGFKGRTRCSLSPIHSDHPMLNTTALVVDTITSSLPSFESSASVWQPYLHYDLADPKFWISRPIDFLVGCDLFTDIITGELVSVLPDMPKLLGTVFGYAVIGRVTDIAEVSSYCALLTAPSEFQSDNLNNQLSRFWELEEPASVIINNPDDEQCENLFSSTHYRLPSGRYVVRMPFKVDNPQIHGTRNLALRRLEQLETKLQRNPALRSQYNNFMQEYLDLGHMELAQRPGKAFIPHHCVFKGEGENRKIRVVFDAAARTSSGSLNDHLLVGPKLQTNMVDIALNFRQFKFVFTTDIVKMFRQVLVHEEDRSYLHILWRFSPEDAVTEFELKTVTYGTAPAPYLAIRALRQVVEDEGAAYPLAAVVIRRDTYVDDLATGAKSLPEALELQRQVVALLSKGEFTLGKWSANHPQLLEICRQQDDASSDPVSLSSSDDNSVKILGLQWDPKLDCFSYNINMPSGKCTKRTVLSAVTKIYDPLGYIGPSVVLAKILIQEAWKLQLSWDQEFPLFLRNRWLDFVESLPKLGNLNIPRWIVPNEGPFQILIFADASERAYCAAAYLRSITDTGPQVHLLLAKTKLAPVKTLTIPRLELCAALLAGRVWQSLSNFCSALPSSANVYFFSDSMVVLSWLQTPTHRLKTFVANRVEKINELTRVGSWQHVASCDNPSDLGSRGILPEDLLINSLWFHGPCWATLEPNDWPTIGSPIQLNVPELKKDHQEELTAVVLNSDDSGIVLVASDEQPIYLSIVDWFEGFSKFTTLVNSLCYVLRFSNKLLHKPTFSDEVLSSDEVENAKQFAVKLCQWQYYFNGNPPKDNTIMPKELIGLNPFCDEAGALLVGGRLKHSNLNWNTKHPYILPGKSYLSSLIVKHYHEKLCHGGATMLLANIRTVYWITGARNLVRQVTRQCVTCRRFYASPIQPPMGDLPAVRFSEGHPFLHVGVDFAGPFFIRDSLRRKAQTSKAYLCLIVCLSTKALHLELVSALSTEAFFAALDRFIGRRGLPEQIVSDNGTNFVGANNALKELYQWYSLKSTQDALLSYATSKQLKWTFTPPHAPFFGGVWEAAVKSVKRLLYSVYEENAFTFEELATWLIKIEAILNSRPLCAYSDDPQDLDYLSPGHFLIGRPLLSVPEKSLLDVKQNRLSRWKLINQRSEHFWNRWRSEYLTSLQVRSKWRRPSHNLQVGDLVLLMEESVPRLRWPIGRIIEIFPGSDGVVRVVNVRTQHSILKRPVSKLVPLFLPDSDSPSS